MEIRRNPHNTPAPSISHGQGAGEARSAQRPSVSETVKQAASSALKKADSFLSGGAGKIMRSGWQDNAKGLQKAIEKAIGSIGGWQNRLENASGKKVFLMRREWAKQLNENAKPGGSTPTRPNLQMMYGMPPARGEGGLTPVKPHLPERPNLQMMYGMPPARDLNGGGLFPVKPKLPDLPNLQMMYGMPPARNLDGGGLTPVKPKLPDLPNLQMMYGMPPARNLDGGGLTPVKPKLPETPNLQMMYGMPMVRLN